LARVGGSADCLFAASEARRFFIASDLPRLSREAETTIFRIVQESLTHIHRHSGSKAAALPIVHDAITHASRLKIMEEV
jgi:signal transduction histidine kinase